LLGVVCIQPKPASQPLRQEPRERSVQQDELVEGIVVALRDRRSQLVIAIGITGSLGKPVPFRPIAKRWANSVQSIDDRDIGLLLQ